ALVAALGPGETGHALKRHEPPSIRIIGMPARPAALYILRPMAQQPWHDPRSILITGASSGIGAALAHAYAKPGRTLFLGGRDGARLEAVAAACRDRGAVVHAKAGDVCDRAAMAAWLAAADGLAPL